MVGLTAGAIKTVKKSSNLTLYRLNGALDVLDVLVTIPAKTEFNVSTKGKKQEFGGVWGMYHAATVTIKKNPTDEVGTAYSGFVHEDDLPCGIITLC